MFPAGKKESGPCHLLHKPHPFQCDQDLRLQHDKSKTKWPHSLQHCFGFLPVGCDGQSLLQDVLCPGKVPICLSVCALYCKWSILMVLNCDMQSICLVLQVFLHRLPPAGLHQKNQDFCAGLSSGLDPLCFQLPSWSIIRAVWTHLYFCLVSCSPVHLLSSWDSQISAWCHLSAQWGKTKNYRNFGSVVG